ncbi:MAG: PTS sugar transporter subunit IIB [Erysipelotrichaceae bacterium]|nr:PTS sugar transporter subunit IIB [Erysipelotrichaceae bacterium]
MEIVHVRIDERLVHAQVANAWVKELGIERLVVIDGSAATDDTQHQYLKMSCPKGCVLKILDTRQATEMLKEDDGEGEKALLLFRGPNNVMRLYNAGICFDEITVGNLHTMDEPKTELTPSVVISDEQKELFRQIAEAGTKVYIQLAPDAEKTNLIDLL